MKTIFLLALIASLVLGPVARAICESDDLLVEIHLTQETFNKGYEWETARFEGEDFVKVTEKNFGISSVYKFGEFEDDGAGNFEVIVRSGPDPQDPVVFRAFHDHEVWETEGLIGFYKSTNRIYQLRNTFRECSWDRFLGQ